MKVCFWAISRTDEAYLKEGMQQYIRRLGPYIPFEYLELGTRGKKNQTAEQHKAAERDEILKLLKPNDHLVLLDEGGKEYTSVAFAEQMQKYFNEVHGSLVFLAGGPYGFHEDIYKRAQSKLSLSKMTYTHQMARLIFLEQLYRAMTILRNEPYHHE